MCIVIIQWSGTQVSTCLVYSSWEGTQTFCLCLDWCIVPCGCTQAVYIFIHVYLSPHLLLYSIPMYPDVLKCVYRHMLKPVGKPMQTCWNRPDLIRHHPYTTALSDTISIRRCTRSKVAVVHCSINSCVFVCVHSYSDPSAISSRPYIKWRMGLASMRLAIIAVRQREHAADRPRLAWAASSPWRQWCDALSEEEQLQTGEGWD